MSSGPLMLAATDTLKTPPMRIGKISENFVLPRAVEVKKVLAVAAGLVLAFPFFVFIGLLPFIGHTLLVLLLTEIAGGFAGLLVVSWSPLKGESFSKWLGLASSSKLSTKVRIRGREAKVYIGIAPLPYSAAGKVRIQGAAVNVVPGNFDERGVPVKKSGLRAN